MLATLLGDIANWATIAAAILSLLALWFVVVQLRGANAAARAQATIAFQAAFKESAKARGSLQSTFPVHTREAWRFTEEQRERLAFWTTLDELSTEQKGDAQRVIAALNDVAQYVSDGLSVRSALQQYHTIFVRVGFLLAPYIEAKNATTDYGKSPARVGVRVIDLYNAGIGYHRCNPKHRGRELILTRSAIDGSGEMALVLLDEHGNGVAGVAAFRADGTRGGATADVGPPSITKVVREAERELRPRRPWYQL